jgi:di/tricarboxylate transporter
LQPLTNEPAVSMDTRNRIWKALVLVLLFLIVQLILRPVLIKPEGWRLLGIFVAAVGGLILQPISGGACVLVTITLASLVGGLKIQEALAGYGDPTVWLVMAAFFIARGLIKTGLARRIALFFVRLVGKSSLGVLLRTLALRHGFGCHHSFECREVRRSYPGPPRRTAHVLPVRFGT